MAQMVLDTYKDNDGVYKVLNPVCLLEDSTRHALQSQPKAGVFIQGACFYKQAFKMWESNGYEVVKDMALADIVCWLGGSDINPKLYGEKPHGSHGFWDSQDTDDLHALEEAQDRFKVGICRGAQLLNVIPNGGKLWQDTNNHGGQHRVTDALTKETYWTNSIHHQQLKLAPEGELIAYATESTFKRSEGIEWKKTENSAAEIDVEAAWYPKTKSLLIQWHPEVGGNDSTKYFFNLMDRYYHAA